MNIPIMEDEMLTIDSNINRPVFVFNPVTNKAFRFVHPLKQKNVEAIMQQLPTSVEQLWIFGSAITHNHFPWSDLDVLVIGKIPNEDIKAIRNASDCEMDLLVKTKEEFNQYCNQFGHCFYRILREGLKLYDRSWFNV